MHPIPGNRTVLATVLDLHPIPQHAVEGPVSPDERRRVGAKDFAECFLTGFLGNIGIDSVDGFPESINENDLLEGITHRPRLAGGDARTKGDLIFQFLEPG